jgi:hypothetical protein
LETLEENRMSTATKAELEAAAEIVYSALTKVSSRPSRSATRAALPTSGFSKRSAGAAKRATSKFIRQTFFIGLEQEVRGGIPVKTCLKVGTYFRIGSIPAV